MRDSIFATAALLAVAGSLAGCGASSSPGLATGSLFGSSDKVATAPPPPKVATPTDRVVQVATTIARAQRCGFVFDPEQLKTSFLAAEAQAGTPPDDMPKLTREFDFTRSKVAATAHEDDNYCTEGRTRMIKASLNRHLAGDFSPAPTQQVAGGGWFDTINQGRENEKFDTKTVFDTDRRQRRPSEY